MELPRFPDGMVAPFKILDGLLPKLRVASPDLIKFEALQVIQDLCRRGGVWRQWVGPIMVDDEKIEVAIPPINPLSEVHTVYQVREGIPNGKDLERIDPLNRSSLRLGGRGIPSKYTQTQPGVIQLNAVPNIGDPPFPLEAYCSIVPLDLCVPVWFQDEHFDTVVKGALANLLMIKGVNYDPGVAVRMAKEYRSRIAHHRINAQSGFSITNRKMLGPYFAMGRQR